MLKKLSIKFYIDEFIDYIVLEKNLSSNTVDNYRSDIFQFCNYFYKSINNPDFKISEHINSKIFTKYIKYLKFKEYKTSTMNRKISSLKNYVNFLEEEKMIDFNPLKYMKLPKNPRKIPKHIIQDLISKSESAIIAHHISAIEFQPVTLPVHYPEPQMQSACYNKD